MIRAGPRTQRFASGGGNGPPLQLDLGATKGALAAEAAAANWGMAATTMQGGGNKKQQVLSQQTMSRASSTASSGGSSVLARSMVVSEAAGVVRMSGFPFAISEAGIITKSSQQQHRQRHQGTSRTSTNKAAATDKVRPCLIIIIIRGHVHTSGLFHRLLPGSLLTGGWLHVLLLLHV